MAPPLLPETEAARYLYATSLNIEDPPHQVFLPLRIEALQVLLDVRSNVDPAVRQPKQDVLWSDLERCE